MRTIVLACLLLFVNATFAQEHVVIRMNGDTLTGKVMQWHTPVMQNPYLALDTHRVAIQDIHSFGNGWLWFVNQGSTPDQFHFIRRTMECSLDLFAEVSKDEILSYPNVDVFGSMRTNEAALPFSHYMHPSGVIYKANYKNLKRDAGMFPVSELALREYKWLRIAQYTAAAVGVGMTSYAASQNDFSPTFVLGLTLTSGSFLFEKPKRERIWQAATYYGIEAEPVE